MPGISTTLFSKAGIRKPAIGLVALLGSSAIAALGLALMASHRWTLLGFEATIQLLLALQWQALGVLVCKLGLDAEAFALVTKNPNARIQLGNAVLWRVAPLALLYCIALAALFSPVVALAICISIVLDVWSVVATAGLNGKQRHVSAAIGTLLNYPLFFLLILFASSIADLNEASAWALFCISGLVRFIWVQMALQRTSAADVIQLQPTWSLTFQPLLNYVLFRADQLFLVVVPIVFSYAVSTSFIAEYVFLAKFAELAAGVVVLIGLVAFPRLSAIEKNGLPTVWLVSGKTWAALPAIAIASVAAASVYRHLYVGSIPWEATLPFALHAALVLPVNYVTFRLFYQRHTASLVRNLVAACGLGSVWLAGAIYLQGVRSLAWVVPIQLVIFLFLAARPVNAAKTPRYA